MDMGEKRTFMYVRYLDSSSCCLSEAVSVSFSAAAEVLLTKS